MNRALRVLVAMAVAMCAPVRGASAATPMAMSMPSSTFLAARLEAKDVVPPSLSHGSGTGVFILSSADKHLSVEYRLTYASLSSPNVRAISLHNFGTGQVGEVVHRICDVDGTRCPEGKDGTISGKWTDIDAKLPLTVPLVTELANSRVYVEIETAAGAELRAQLAPSPFMAMSQQALIPLQGDGALRAVTGTAALRFVRFTPDRAELGILLTVAGADENPTSVQLVDRARHSILPNLVPTPEASSGRTLRIVVESKRLHALMESSFDDALMKDGLSLVVHLGKGGTKTLSAPLTFAR